MHVGDEKLVYQFYLNRELQEKNTQSFHFFDGCSERKRLDNKYNSSLATTYHNKNLVVKVANIIYLYLNSFKNNDKLMSKC